MMKIIGRWICSWICPNCGHDNGDSGQHGCYSCGAGR